MKKFFYVLETCFLGHRYHGWQKQTNATKTVQQQIDRKLKYLLGENNFKTLPASRTDKMVSAFKHYFQIYAENPIDIKVLERLNEYLPDDIAVTNIFEVDSKFQIIGSAEFKEYHYYFANTKAKYPFAAPYMTFIQEELDIERMKKACSLFLGEHNFRSYCYRPNENKEFIRTIDECGIFENDLLKANFFPPLSFYFKVKSKGFFRHQIRLMMGTLFKLGLGEISEEDIKTSLATASDSIGYVAPPSGLILVDTQFSGLT